MSTPDFISFSHTTDGPNGRNRKRWVVCIEDVATTKADVDLVGYFNKYNLRAAAVGDMIRVYLNTTGLMDYKVISPGRDADGNITKQEIGAGLAYMTTQIYDTDLNGIVDLAEKAQDLDGTGVTNLMANAAFNAAMTTLINSVITGRFSFDGTTLCFDFNNDGNPAA